MGVIEEEALEQYYNFLKMRVKTGNDRITKHNFAQQKKIHFRVIKEKTLRATYKFTSLKSAILSSGRIVYTPTIRDRIVIEHLKDQLKTKYRVQYRSRESIISSIVNKLKTGMPFFIIRLDIKDFFPSLPQQMLLRKLKTSSLLSYEEYSLIKKLVKLSGNKGIPPGLSISNVLSEIFLENFDISIKKVHSRVSNYFRFVDDILLIINGKLTSKEMMVVKKELDIIFKDNGIKMNEEKIFFNSFDIKNQKQDPFEYLGYRFETENKKLKVSIAKKKLDKIFERIDKVFKEFETDQNVTLLIERLKYLVSKKRSVKVSRFISKDKKVINKEKRFYFGVIESYKEVNDDHEIWLILDKFIKSRIILLKHKGLLIRGVDLRQLYSCSFQRYIKNNEIYKIDKISIQELINKLSLMEPHIPQSFWGCYPKESLLGHYFSLVDLGTE